MALTLLKLGGELLEDPARLAAIAAAIAGATEPLVVVHGGGREIDAALKRAGIAKRQVEGLRVTDAATLDVVVEVLAGAVNTRLVAAIVSAGGRAVGLTGADAGLVPVEKAPPHRSVDGTITDLERVGHPIGEGRPALAADLIAAGYVPVVASIAGDANGVLYNVNADTLAADLAARLGAARLVIAGATPGVLDENGERIEALDLVAASALVSSGVASAGMIAKLNACRDAITGGVEEVLLVEGQEGAVLARALEGSQVDLPATRMVAVLEARAGSNR
jgi:acetylglutamate kinase